MNRSTTKPGFQGGYALFWGQHFKIHGTTGFGQFLGFANFDPPQPWKTPAFDAPGPLTQAVAARALGVPDPGR